MITFKNITIKNFLSVGAVTQAVSLNGTPLTLILGENADTTGTLSRNGSGKTTILQAISYAIYAKPLTKIKIPNLINNINGKQMLVTLEFETGGRTYRIERGKKPDVMRFYVDDEEQTATEETDVEESSDETQGENRETQKEITRLVGMSYDLFKHILALNTFTDPFLKLGSPMQRTIMEELFGIMLMSHKGKALSEAIKSTKDRIKFLEADIRAKSEANSRIEAAIQGAELKVQTWDREHEAKITNLVADLEEMMTLDFDAELSVFDALDAYREKKREIDQQITDEEREHRSHSSDVSRLIAEETLYRQNATEGAVKQVERLRAEAERAFLAAVRHDDAANAFTSEADDLANAPQDGSCALCGQSTEGTPHHHDIQDKLSKKISNLRTRATTEIVSAKDRRTESAKITAEAEKLIVDSATLSQEWLDKAHKTSEVLTETRNKLDSSHIVLERLKTELTTFGAAPKPLFGSRDELFRTRQERDRMEHSLETEISLVNPHLGQVSDLQTALQSIVYDELNEATEMQKHQEFLLKLLMDKSSFIRKKIMDQNLFFVNQQMAHYLEKLCLPHDVVFQSDLSVEITLLGRDFDFEQLSRGEMNRVIMATSWAFRDVWESVNQSCNLLFVDEMIDSGMDTQGVEAAISILKDMTRTSSKNVFLISHKDELQSRIDKTLVVRKENGFTSFDTAEL
jgi:DNA repair exonuclease SbcCD ATPase subunit